MQDESRNCNRLLLTRSVIIHFTVLIPLIVFLAFYNLSSGSNFGTGTGIDESWYVQVSQEMSATGKWWLPTRENIPFFYKPPLKFWLTSLSSYALGESIVAYRLVDALLGSLLVVLAYFVGSVVFSSLNAGFFSALTLLSCHGFLFLNGIRFATLDTLVNFLATISLLLLYWVTNSKNEANKKELMSIATIVGLLIGLAVLTKSALGYYVFVVYLLWILFTGQFFSCYKSLKFFLFGTVFFSLIVPMLWFLPHALLTPGAWQRMFGYELVGRFAQGFHNTNNRSYYWNLFLQSKYLPVYTTLLATFMMTIKSFYFRDKRIAFFLIWGVSLFIIFTLLSSRLPWYVAPCYFPLAILNGALIDSFLQKFTSINLNFRNMKILTKNLAYICFFGFLFFGTVGETLNYVYANVRHVAVGSPRLAIDQVVEDISKIQPSPETYTYKSNTIATRERIFYNMLDKPPTKLEKIDNFQKLLEINQTYVLFTSLKQALELTDQQAYQAYKVLPPVDFPQGPDGFYRYKSSVVFLGTQNLNSLAQASSFVPRKVVLQLSWDGSTCRKIEDITGRGISKNPITAQHQTITCQFGGNALLGLVPSRVALNIGHVHKENEELPNLEVYANNKLVGAINRFHSRLNVYNFAVPPGTWFEGDNYLKISIAEQSLKDRMDPKQSKQQSMVLRWAVVDLNTHSNTQEVYE